MPSNPQYHQVANHDTQNTSEVHEDEVRLRESGDEADEIEVQDEHPHLKERESPSPPPGQLHSKMASDHQVASVTIDLSDSPLASNEANHNNSVNDTNHEAVPIVITQNDGVFANMSAKPDTSAPAAPDTELPSYTEVVQDTSPPYFDNTILSPIFSGGDLLVDDLPIGSIFSLFWNLLVSTCFQVVGFLLTYLLHNSHAAKCGSFAGLGITFLHYGFYIRGKVYEEQLSQYVHKETSSPTHPLYNVYVSYLLMVIGWFIILRSISEYVRVRRLHAIQNEIHS